MVPSDEAEGEGAWNAAQLFTRLGSPGEDGANPLCLLQGAHHFSESRRLLTQIYGTAGDDGAIWTERLLEDPRGSAPPR